MSDTSPEMQKRYRSLIAQKSPAERLRMASSMFDAGITLMRAGLKSRHKGLSEAQLRGQTFMRLYGGQFTGAEIQRIATAIPNMQLDVDR